MLRRFRFVAILMIIAILTCRIGIVNVNAAEGVTSQNTAKELSGLRITDLDKPVAGRILDQKARVRTNENVTWEIPVIWVDDLGNTAYEAVPGRTYYPSFAFYVPEGYTISTKATGAGLGIKLPDFLSAVFGNTPYIFVGDAATGITYITYIPSYIESKASNADTSSASIDRAASIWPGHDGTQNTTHEDPYGENHADDDNDKPAGGHAAPSPQPQPVADPYEQVRIHCSADVIDRIGLEALNELVTLIKNKLEPQAVNLLKNSFEGYRNATSELGKQIGLYIYYENGAVIDSAGDSNPSPAGALAYVSAGYTDIPEGGTVFEYVMGLDTSSFMEQDPDTGNWQIKESEKDNLDNTIVHELMHAFMYDYTRRGMGIDDRYPVWFMEGIASTVENVYQFRSYLFQELSDTTRYVFNYDKVRYVLKDEYSESGNYRLPYSNNSILTKYSDENLTGGYRYDLSHSADEENTASAYVSGYLAVVYLGYLAAVRDGYSVVTAPNYDRGVYPDVDIDLIRYGTGRIIDMLHEGYSLDSVIQHISSRGADDANPYYESTADFAARFITGDDEDSNTRTIYGNNAYALGSLEFCNYYLNYLEDKGYADGDYTHLSTGSILSSDQHIISPLDHDRTAESAYYTIVDSGEYVESTVDEIYNTAGGRTRDYIEGDPEDANEPEEGLANAARPIEVVEAAPESTDSTPAAQEADVVAAVSEPGMTEPSATEPEITEPVVTEPAAEPQISVSEEPGELIPPASGIEPEMPAADPELVPDQLVSEGEPCTIIPHEEDAIVPEYNDPVSEPAGEPDSDGGDDGGNDGGGDDGGSDDSGDSGNDGGSDEVSGSEE